MSTKLVSRDIPTFMIMILMIIMIAEYYLNIEGIAPIAGELRNWGIILSGFSLILGAGNLIISQGRHIIRRTPGRWWYGIVLLGTMMVYLVLGLALGPTSSQYQWLYTNIFAPSNMVVWGLPVFWLASASYRTFRARNVEATVLLIAGIITLLGFAPVGAVIYEGIPGMSSWIIQVPTIGASRGIVIGAGIGTFALAMRILLGREKTHLGQFAEES
jgi:hypothetical protein